MADQKATQLLVSNPITADPGDLLYGVKNTATTPASGAFKASSMMFNRYRIVRSVASNDLTVAITLEDGTTAPSTDKPLSFKIGNTRRELSAACTFTSVDGTNKLNLGSAEHATQVVYLFVYAVYETTASFTGVKVLISRIAHATTMADFSATDTNELGFLWSGNTRNVTDEVVVIGMINVTLSAGAGYTWSVPATSFVQSFPLYETPDMIFAPVWASSGTQPAIVNGTIVGIYKVRRNRWIQNVRLTAGGSTTFGTGTYTFSNAFTAKTLANSAYPGAAAIYDNSTDTLYAANANVVSGGAVTNIRSHATVGVISPTVPVTLAASDQIIFSIEPSIA